MIILPAIDLRGGRCVRLLQGRPDAETVFSHDPAAVARHWAEQGATWLHVVDLDAALGAHSPNRPLVAAIAAQAGVPVEFGGGLRSMESIEQAFGLGVTRIVLGTAAVTNPELVEAALERFGAERVVVGIDSRQGKVTVHGWQQTGEQSALDLAQAMKALGVTRIACTDVARDGTLAGPSLDALREIAGQSGLQVIASGGVAALDHLRALAATPGIEGAIVGQALYTNAFTLPQALQAAAAGPETGAN